MNEAALQRDGVTCKSEASKSRAGVIPGCTSRHPIRKNLLDHVASILNTWILHLCG